MARAELPRLTYLEIGMATVSNEDLDILGGLRALIILKLRSGDSDKQRVVIGGQAGFPLLELFWLERRDGAITVTGLSFKERAMPKLRKLRLRCKYNALGLGAALAGPELGLGNLGSLKQVHVKMDLEGVADPDVEAAVAAVTKAANVPSKCRLEISVSIVSAALKMFCLLTVFIRLLFPFQLRQIKLGSISGSGRLHQAPSGWY
uniref:Disease resistance R13L4/SHOC-2-like LRR domain-containing protein n=2 Tax=Setaria viridis TaxID=4556 RepID=A0A4U6TWD2_SETVI|nr:hypothetical protein SEVIR_7G305601v2 [Setaria viridis]